MYLANRREWWSFSGKLALRISVGSDGGEGVPVGLPGVEQ